MTHSCQFWINRFRDDFLQRGRSETSWLTQVQDAIANHRYKQTSLFEVAPERET